MRPKLTIKKQHLMKRNLKVKITRSLKIWKKWNRHKEIRKIMRKATILHKSNWVVTSVIINIKRKNPIQAQKYKA